MKEKKREAIFKLFSNQKSKLKIKSATINEENQLMSDYTIAIQIQIMYDKNELSLPLLVKIYTTQIK